MSSLNLLKKELFETKSITTAEQLVEFLEKHRFIVGKEQVKCVVYWQQDYIFLDFDDSEIVGRCCGCEDYHLANNKIDVYCDTCKQTVCYACQEGGYECCRVESIGKDGKIQLVFEDERESGDETEEDEDELDLEDDE